MTAGLNLFIRVTLFYLWCPSLIAVQQQCYSCTTYCKTLPNGRLDPETCDCEGTTPCLGDQCFVKIETFHDEFTAIIQKGCVAGLPIGQEGCHYAGQSESVHCYCTGEKCNNKLKMEFYMPKILPSVECCECSEPHGDECSNTKCARTCKGNYCLIDFDGIEQGCGLGIPRLHSFMRTNEYAKYQGQTTCARYEATQTTVVHGCVCTEASGFCNEVNKSRNYQLERVIDRRSDDQNYCYSLHEKSKQPFEKDIFRKSDTCEGHYCFISLTTSELVVEGASFEQNYEDQKNYIGMSRPRFEIMAGCLKVDRDEKVSIGCTTEYATNTSDIISKHCICESHLCNYFNLLTNEENTNTRQIVRPKSKANGIEILEDASKQSKQCIWILNLQAKRAFKWSSYSGILTNVPNCRSFASDKTSKPNPSKPSKPTKPTKPSKEISDVKNNTSYLDEILIHRESEPKTTAQKVKKKAENTFYYLVFFGSVVALGALGYYFVEQFLAADSPQTIYSKALKMVRDDERCESMYGTGIKGFGEDTGRGRRRHIAHQRYITNEGEERVRVMFHVKGDKHTGKVFAEVAKKDGMWDYRFVYTVTDDTIPRTVVMLGRANRSVIPLVKPFLAVQSVRFYPARGTKPKPRNLWDKRHLDEITGGEYTHLPLRVDRLGGRDPDTGRKVNQHIGGGVKFDYFMVDFHRRGPTVPDETYDERVLEVRRDANRSAYIALVAGEKGKRWILATENMAAGQVITTSCYIPPNPVVGVEGNAYPLGALSTGTLVNCIERYPMEDSDVFVIAAGAAGTIVRHQGNYVIVRLPHKHEFSFHKTCMTTVGRLSHPEFHDLIFGSANMHRRFGYKMSSGLWHKKDGYCGRKIRPLPPVRVLETPEEAPSPNQKFTLTRRQLGGLYGPASTHPLVTQTQFRF